MKKVNYVQVGKPQKKVKSVTTVGSTKTQTPERKHGWLNKALSDVYEYEIVAPKPVEGLDLFKLESIIADQAQHARQEAKKETIEEIKEMVKQIKAHPLQAIYGEIEDQILSGLDDLTKD